MDGFIIDRLSLTDPSTDHLFSIRITIMNSISVDLSIRKTYTLFFETPNMVKGGISDHVQFPAST